MSEPVKRYFIATKGHCRQTREWMTLHGEVVSASDYDARSAAADEAVSERDALAQRCRELEHSLAVKEEFYQDALHSHIVLAEQRDTLRAEVEALRKDKDRLDAIEGNCWYVRYNSSPNGDAGDSSISIEIVGHFMDEPCERVVGENYHENLRAAIDQAMTADAYPPARPEYDEEVAIDADMEGSQ